MQGSSVYKRFDDSGNFSTICWCFRSLTSRTRLHAAHADMLETRHGLVCPLQGLSQSTKTNRLLQTAGWMSINGSCIARAISC